MKLVSARVKNYKSIEDSEPTSIEPDVTTLVGKNESGKSAFLEALYRLNPGGAGLRNNFEELYDYPRRKRSMDRSGILETQPVEAEFELDNKDIQAVEEQFGSGILQSNIIKISKNYSNKRLWETKLNEKAAVMQFASDAHLSSDLVKSIDTLKDLHATLQQQDERSDLAEQLLQKLTDFDLHTAVREILIPLLPRFLYFDEYSTLPGRFSIPYIQRTNEQSMGSQERTALAFLRLAGVDSAEFLEDEYEARKAALEAAAIHISEEVFEFWSQNKELEVDVDVDFKAPNQDEQLVSPFLEIRIRNNRHRVSINFSERSTGFVWFFSFLAYFSEFRNQDENLILLLDEPGLGLHAAAQEDLLKFIDERLAPHHQVVYTTHSAFMINPVELQRARTVEDKDNIGTKVSEEVLSVGRDTITPLQNALGIRLSQTLFVGHNNLVVEGPSDMLYMQILSTHLRTLGREALDPRWTLVPAGGADKIPAFVALLRTQLNLAVILDVASGGNQRVDSLVRRGILERSNVFELTQITGGNEADIEDLFEVGFYLDLLRGAGVANVKVRDLPPRPRTLKRLETHLGTTFDHYQPAAYFQREQPTMLKKVNEKTLQRFENLFQQVNQTLDHGGT